ncbi:hypothetical protein L208DRAFT_1451907 [Tricholoma matsutake]|nr:hypothetical protein L208DRAFT_1451907 [Tricholoma matsutake 945]
MLEKLPPAYSPTHEPSTTLLPEILRKPLVGIICRSGLSGLVESFKDVVKIPYEKIPGFSKSTVTGHQSEIAFGLLGGRGGGVPAVAMLGCIPTKVTVVYPIRVMARLGVEDIIITNAAGSLNPNIPVGTIVVIQDHFALPTLTGMNPLLGPQTSPSHPRFLPLSDAYSPALRRLAFIASHQLSLDKTALAEGTYAWVSGPTYETPAEGRFLRNAGADVGYEHEEGLNVLVLSLVTNFVVIPDKGRSIREEVEAEVTPGKKVEQPVMHVISHERVLEIRTEKAI